MKRLLFTLLILCHIVAYSQNSSDFSSRAKQGLLTYEECMAVSYDQ